MKCQLIAPLDLSDVMDGLKFSCPPTRISESSFPNIIVFDIAEVVIYFPHAITFELEVVGYF